MQYDKTLIIIPARMGSTRLPNKPLAIIDNRPMIICVAQQAKKTNCPNILVATDDKKIIKIVEEHKFQAFLTKEDHSSGSDRIYEALCAVDPDEKYEYIVNLQGDLPTIDPKDISALIELLHKTKADIVTLGTKIQSSEEKNNPNIVKIIASPYNQKHFRALYFTRANAPYGSGPSYHHIGIYGYNRRSLKKFVKSSPSLLEQQEKLEQLRALENNMTIEGIFVDHAPMSVDTAEDLKKIKHFFLNQKTE